MFLVDFFYTAKSHNFHYLDKNSFGDLSKLRHLYLDGNQVTVLTSGVLTGEHDYLFFIFKATHYLTSNIILFSVR